MNERAVFCIRNALKVTYMHLQFQKFCQGYTPRPLLKEGITDQLCYCADNNQPDQLEMVLLK
jgi:hypothetical protein